MARAKKIVCPKCGSVSYTVLGERRTGFSIGKALGGAFIAGHRGLLAGFLGKNGYDIVCNSCNHMYRVK